MAAQKVRVFALSTCPWCRKAKQFFKEHEKDYKKGMQPNNWFLIFGKVESGNFDIFSNIINEIEEIKSSH